MQLVVNNLLVGHLLFVLVQELLSHFVIVLFHLHLLEFIPLNLDLLLDLSLSLFQLELHVPLLHGVA